MLLEKVTPDILLDAIQKYGVTITWTSPLMYRNMSALAKKYDISSLKQCVSAGEALPASTRSMFKEATGIEIVDGIGATEMLHIFISAAGEDVRPGATGKPIPGYRACIVDDDGKQMPNGSVGRLAVKGPTGCRYLADERQKIYVQNGWNVTGDAYYLDDDGYYWYQSRTDDIIITSGYNVAPPEVEDALLQHPAVAECAVVGAPDEERGQIIKAFVVLRKGAGLSEEDVIAWCEGQLARFKCPTSVEFVTKLPHSATGKVRKAELRGD